MNQSSFILLTTSNYSVAMNVQYCSVKILQDLPLDPSLASAAVASASALPPSPSDKTKTLKHRLLLN